MKFPRSVQLHKATFLKISPVAMILAFASLGRTASIEQTYVRHRGEPVISEWSASVISQTANDKCARIWVFFTDKGFYDDRGFAAAVADQSVRLTPKAAARRAKMGRADVELIDLPVRQVYVDRVIDLGGTLRQRSRWLNAASFDIDMDRLPILAGMPFVQEIRPVIGFKDPGDKIDGTVIRPAPPAARPASATSLNYGTSLGQLQMINVPAAHDLGYHGEGVIVCMMDTGARKNHSSFALAYSENRVLAEHDFVFHDGNVQNEVGDDPGQDTHGTLTWSTLGGASDGSLYGPAFKAQFILAKTEYIPTETQVEEDNWMAGMEWADSIGADVISSSLAYSDWYVYANYNGDYCVTTKAADMAATLGIVVCNAMGNSGPGAGTLAAPADADSILSCGAVNSLGTIANFSSRGPTSDGRTKPEVCAQGVSTVCANPNNPAGFTTASGTSLSTPLIGGAVAVVLSAHLDWTPMQVREALMQTATRAKVPPGPDNTYGEGIIDVVAAINYPFCAPVAPTAPVTLPSPPCANVPYAVAWHTVPAATGYQLFEGTTMIYDDADTTAPVTHASGSYTYYVRAKNGCDIGHISPASASVTIQSAPGLAPSSLQTSAAELCNDSDYTITWNSVGGATAYELYENSNLIYTGPNPFFSPHHASGDYSYFVKARNACGAGPASATGAASSLHRCPCNGDPHCDSLNDVLDVVDIIGEAFRGAGPTKDPTCVHASRNDVNCDCTVNVLDVTLMIGVAFRGVAPSSLCNACIAPCP